MEAKKNPSQDVHRQSFKFFLIGIAISVSIEITAFEWTSKKVEYPSGEVTDPLLFESSITVLPPLYEVPKTTPITAKKNPTSPQILTSTSLPDNGADNLPDVIITDDVSEINTGTIYDLPKEDSTEIIFLAEVQPKPVGGYESFYSQLSKNLKYPRQAIRNGVDGKVYVEFVVDRNGKVNHIKVLKGIGAGCDEEAMRVLALTNWEPGKQRGRPVRVRMVIPVVFKVQ